MDSKVFVPAEKQGVQVAEFDVEEVLGSIGSAKPGEEKFVDFPIPGKRGQYYTASMGNPRYHLFAHNRACVCCGVIGNRWLLDQQTDPKFHGSLHFNLYAETGTRDNPSPHYILMVKDRIIPKKQGGGDDYENLQTMCCNCSYMREHADLSIEQIRRVLFVAYRIYKSTFVLHQTQSRLHKLDAKHRKAVGTVEHINDALDAGLIKDEKKVELIAKIARCRVEAKDLAALIRKIELDAQVSGIIPEESALEAK